MDDLAYYPEDEDIRKYIIADLRTNGVYSKDDAIYANTVHTRIKKKMGKDKRDKVKLSPGRTKGVMVEMVTDKILRRSEDKRKYWLKQR